MIIKKYKFTDIHNLLKKNNFKKVFKIKMKFRKSFEYIYKNTKIWIDEKKNCINFNYKF